METLPLTQTEVAGHLGVSPGLVSQWKSGHARITSAHAEGLKRLARNTRPTVSDEERNESDTPSESPSYGGWLAEQLYVIKETQATFAKRSKVNPMTISNLINGKTDPQQGTRRKIEKALSKRLPPQHTPRRRVSPAPVADPSGPVIGIPFKIAEISQAPNAPGVYVIHDTRGWPTYVGKGNLRTELKLHFGKKWATEHSAAKFSYALVGHNHDADRIETILIKFMADSLLVNVKKRVSVAR